MFFLRKEWTKNLNWMQLLCKAEEMTYSFHTLSLLKLRNWQLFFLWTSFAQLQFFLKTILHACAARQFLHCRRHFTAHARRHAHLSKRHARTSIFHPLGEKLEFERICQGGLFMLLRHEYSIWFTRQTLSPRWELLISGYAPRCLRLYMALVYRRRSLWLMSKWWFIGSYLNIPGREVVGDRGRDGKSVGHTQTRI